jgi:hypothetical protein
VIADSMTCPLHLLKSNTFVEVTCQSSPPAGCSSGSP